MSHLARILPVPSSPRLRVVSLAAVWGKPCTDTLVFRESLLLLRAETTLKVIIIRSDREAGQPQQAHRYARTTAVAQHFLPRSTYTAET